MPGDSGASAVNTRVHTSLPPAHTGLRVHWAPGIPHALSGADTTINPGAIRAAGRERMLENTCWNLCRLNIAAIFAHAPSMSTETRYRGRGGALPRPALRGAETSEARSERVRVRGLSPRTRSSQRAPCLAPHPKFATANF